ncbi:MAG: hypothetical protein QGH45_04750 [Myxococcota bacterium]|jgi:hypothetical protein|nr:hypothetical protein [Myxococcota bacterium]
MQRRYAWTFFVTLALCGCPTTENPGGDDPEDWGCDTEQIDLGTDEISSLGYAPADVVALVEGSFADEIVWWDDTLSAIELEFEYRGDAWVIEKTPWGIENGPDDLLDWCVSSLVIGVELAVTTADGRLDVDMVHSVASSSSTRPQLRAFPTAGLNSPDGDGTFVLDPEEWDEIGTGLYVTFDAGGTTGEIDEYGAKLDVQENPIEQTWETVATWPPAG